MPPCARPRDRAILLVNGRVEGYLKYQELAWDLWRQGYSLYLIDHRGQGLSDRLLADKEKGYVADFDDYVLDLKQFHDDVILADKPAKLFLLAHSMGGAISARYLERWPDDIKAAVLSSPHDGHQPRRPAQVAGTGAGDHHGYSRQLVGRAPMAQARPAMSPMNSPTTA